MDRSGETSSRLNSRYAERKGANRSEFITSVRGVCCPAESCCRPANMSPSATEKMTEYARTHAARFDSQPRKSYTCVKSDFKGTGPWEISRNRNFCFCYLYAFRRALKNRSPSRGSFA